MKAFAAILIFLFCNVNSVAVAQELRELQVGDVILESLNCYICSVIENETGAPYSHSAIVVAVRPPQIFVAQALGQVHELSLQDFVQQRKKNSTWAVYRTLQGLTPQQKSQLQKNYVTKFRGLPFDQEYRWDNFDSEGRELLYCSEFVTKLLNTVLPMPLLPYELDFRKNAEIWQQYYKGQVPQGKPGNSPAFFVNPQYFKLILHSQI